MTNKQIEKKDLPAGRQVEFKSGKNTLRGSLFVPIGNGPFPGIIFFHGSESDRQGALPICEKLLNKDYLCLAFDFSGHGESDDKFENLTYSQVSNDGQAALDFIYKQNIDKNRIGFRGSSMGGYVAASLVKKNDIKSLLLSVPVAYAYPNEKMVDSIDKGNKYLNDEKNWIKSETLNCIKKFKGSLLVVRNEFDEILLKEMVESYFNEASEVKMKKLYLLKGAKHSTHDNPKAKEKQQRIAVEWFLKTL